MNKNFFKLAGLIFCLSIIDALVILYWWIMAILTESSFYFNAFEWGAIIYLFGVPALILFLISLIILSLSKWYKGNVSNMAIAITTIVSVIIFIAPFIFYLSFKKGPKTYQGYQKLSEQNTILQQREKEQEHKQTCLKYKLYMSQWKQGDPMPTFDPIDCI